MWNTDFCRFYLKWAYFFEDTIFKAVERISLDNLNHLVPFLLFADSAFFLINLDNSFTGGDIDAGLIRDKLELLFFMNDFINDEEPFLFIDFLIAGSFVLHK